VLGEVADMIKWFK